jgi:cytochrome b6-f complex iron-sulfur subunit
MAAARFDRRRLLNWFLGTSFGGLVLSVLYPILRYVTPPRIAEASMNEVEGGLAEDPQLIEKGFKIVRFGADPVIVVRTADAKFYAYSATCTHLDCIVGFQKQHGRIWCNCHGGGYDLAGRNIIGPPPKPLTAYKVNLVEKSPGNSTVVITKV